MLHSVNVPVIQDVQNLDLKTVLSLAAFPKLPHLFREQMLSPADICLKHMAVDLQVRKDINKICMTWNNIIQHYIYIAVLAKVQIKMAKYLLRKREYCNIIVPQGKKEDCSISGGIP